MALTTKQIYDLNNSMSAAQNVNLGTMLGGLGTVASGSFLPTVAETNIDTGLTTVVLGFATMSGSPTLVHSSVSATAGSVAGYINVLCWQPTSSSDTTPIAATGFTNVNWIAIGT